MSNRPARYLRRDWSHKKPHLAKHNSLPILQLTPSERPIFQCEQCGFLNTLIPMCLWCCWTSDAAHEQFYLSTPRARRISAPSRVALSVAISKDVTMGTVVFAETHSGHHANANMAESIQQQGINRGNSGTTPVDITAAGDGKVATATTLAQATTGKSQSPSIPSRTTSVRLRTSIPSFLLPSQSQQSSSEADGPNPNMNTLKSMKSLKPSKPSRFSLFLDFNAGRTDYHAHETKMQSDDANVSPVSGGERQQRTLRRKRRMNIVEPTTHNAPAASPIAISLNLKDNSRPSSLEQKLSPASPSRPQPLSIEPPNTPPSSTLPLDSPTTPTPVRVGHPNRPYYTAIRKNMSSPSPSSSPPPSRPTSLMGSSPSRPESYPPSSFHHRPLSLCLTTTNLFSPFAIDNTEDQTLGPESAPAALTGSLSNAFSFPPRPHSSTSATNTNTKPNKKARESVGSCSGSIGFSMSGETELRMALASVGSDSGASEFRFRETTPSVTTATTPSGSSSQDHHSAGYVKGAQNGRRGSMSGVISRVKQFRKSLKDLLVPKSQV